MGDEDLAQPSLELKRAEEAVEAHSAVFKKQLGLTDLVLTQVLFVVGLNWVGTAGKLSHSHIVFWLLAIALFYIPTAAVVIYLNEKMPLEGGLYQWARLGFNEFFGFLAAWNLWLYVIMLLSEVGLLFATNLGYALGPGVEAHAGDRSFILFCGIVVIGALSIATIFGLGIGKWIHNAGGIIIMLVFATLIALPFIALAHGEITHYNPFQIEAPTISLLSLNILGKMGFAALGGFEYVAILAGECRQPARTIGRSVIISAPIIGLMFILGTSSVLAFLKPDEINLIGPIPQVLSIGLRPLGLAARIAPVIILAFLGIRLAQASVNFTANSRLPMVAGWDRLLPQWFTHLHPKYKTPVNSIIFVGAMTLLASMAGMIGVAAQEAYQLLQSASVIFYAFSYLVMLALPLIGLRGISPRPPVWLKIAACSGFAMTLLNVVLSVFPIIQVESWWSFGLKTSGVIVAGNLVGILIFAAAERRKNRDSLSEPVPAT
ncbi:MAG TPA: APC family permease [Blastocatellia bacterium]